ncbi:hypothetical protein B0H19DRAFT_1009036, partial [Mycena capillaripes]
MPRVPERVVARPLVIVVDVNGEPVRALVDSGSLGDLVSSSLADQLRLKPTELEEPITLQLAVQGSRFKINHSVRVKLSYQDIVEERNFLVAKVCDIRIHLYAKYRSIGLNSSPFAFRSGQMKPTHKSSSNSVGNWDTKDEDILIAEMSIYCPIKRPNIDEDKIYPWRPSRCPEALRDQWDLKRQTYLKAGRWEVTNSGNTAPMLLIPK